MKFVAYIFFCCISLLGVGQDDVLTIADSMPKYPGGNKELALFIQKNIQYNPRVLPEGKSTKAYVKFIVDTAGKVNSPVIVKSSGYKELDEAAIKVVSMLPAWESGLDKNKKVRVYMNLPFSFKNLGLLLDEPKVTLSENKVLYYYTQGVKLSDKKLYKEAVSKFDSCLILSPNHVNAHFNKAAMHLQLNEKNLACESWNKIVAIQKDTEVEALIKKHCN